MYKYKRIVVKVGSNVLTHKDGTLDLERMSNIVSQLAQLHKKGVEVILISSGAVASGRSELKIEEKLDAVSARQIYSAVGQAKLINNYYEMFRNHNMYCGQVLTTKENFGSRRHYLNQKNCITEMLSHGLVPIVNENDTISVTELMFTDNDELSGLLATMMNAEALIILSNIDGIYNGNPSNPASSVIRYVESGKDLSQYIQTGKSTFGRGGMHTKTSIAQKVADEGINVIIANGKTDNILPDLLDPGKDIVCTQFEANAHPVSNVKKWIAHSESFAKGEVHLNEQASIKIQGENACSILFVGITKIEGEFEKDDIVKICDNKGTQIGVGRVQFDSTKSRTLIGQKNKKPLVHYDYLYLD